MRNVTWLAVALTLCSCNALQRLTSDNLMEAALLQTPASKNPTPGGTQTPFPALVTAQVFFGTRQDNGNPSTPPSSEAAPVGVSGATVTLTWNDGTANQSVTLAPDATTAGKYSTDSTKSTNLTFEQNTSYTFTVVSSGTTYTALVTSPTAANITEFAPPAPSPLTKSIGDPSTFPFQITLTSNGTANPISFYDIYGPFTTTTKAVGTPTCTNGPDFTQAGQLLQFVFDPSKNEAAQYSVPQSPCFPAQGGYLVQLTTMAKGTQFSNNLFVGSAVLAGTGYVGELIMGP